MRRSSYWWCILWHNASECDKWVVRSWWSGVAKSSHHTQTFRWWRDKRGSRCTDQLILTHALFSDVGDWGNLHTWKDRCTLKRQGLRWTIWSPWTSPKLRCRKASWENLGLYSWCSTKIALFLSLTTAQIIDQRFHLPLPWLARIHHSCWNQALRRCWFIKLSSSLCHS